MTGPARIDQTTDETLAPWLVTSAITGRTQVTGLPARFPSRDLVGTAAASLDRTANPDADRHYSPDARVGLAETAVWDGAEGPRSWIRIAPGMVQVGTVDLARGERALERRERARRHDVDMLTSWSSSTGELPPPRPTIGDRGVITGWSAKSRANMVRTLCTLDFSDLIRPGDRPIGFTLTYPGDWLPVAPNGSVVKRHLKAFRKRWIRKYGDLRAVWKLEFQRRGAPHLHLLTVLPTGVSLGAFREWALATWADVVAHPDPIERMKHESAGITAKLELRMRDPKRIGVYFSKHGVYAAKDYQNDPPEEWVEAGESIGRFWGYWGLKPATAVVPLTRDQSLLVSRTLRRWQRQNRYQRPVTVARVEQSTGRIRYRTTHKWVTRMPGSAGFVAVNDGPSVAMMLDRLLTPPTPTPRHRPNPSTQQRNPR